MPSEFPLTTKEKLFDQIERLEGDAQWMRKSLSPFSNSSAADLLEGVATLLRALASKLEEKPNGN